MKRAIARSVLAALAVGSGALLTACADVLGLQDLQEGHDAQAPSPIVSADGAVPANADAAAGQSDGNDDASTPASEPDASGDDSGSCTPQSIALDAVGAKGAVSASRVETYAFTIASPEVIVARVRTGTWNAEVAVGSACDGTGSGLPAPSSAPDGSYTRGALQPGTYYLRVAWDKAVPPSTPYTFDVMSETLATNACTSPTVLTTATSLNGNTFEGSDLTSGCPAVPVYGQLFYSVTVPANAGWEVTATPGNWTMVLEALTSCTTPSCAVPSSVSPSAGAAATIELNNTTAASKTFVIGVSANARDGASGGGAFTLAAQALSRCPTEGATCNTSSGTTGLCCSGICEPQGTQNSCGTTCGTACPLTYEVCAKGGCACPSTLATSCPPACVDTTSDPNNCGKCNAHCATSDPHAVGVTCNKGACAPLCNSSYPTNCSGACTNLKDDNNNCGECGTRCTGGRTCASKSCVCTNPADPDDCGGASCTNLKTDNNNCGKCGVACSKVDPNATGTCDGTGHCALVCKAGYKMCTAGQPCVHVLGNDNSNCGDCGVKCATTDPTQTASCQAGTCVTSCKPQDTCPGGACTDRQSDPNNCGTCGNVCPVPDGGAVASCVKGVCQ